MINKMNLIAILIFLLSFGLHADNITGVIDSVRGELRIGSITYSTFGDAKSGTSMVFADNDKGIRKKFMNYFNKAKKKKKKVLFCFEGVRIKYRGRSIAFVNSPLFVKETSGSVGKVKAFKSKKVFNFGLVKSSSEQRLDNKKKAEELIRKNKERNGL